MHVKCSMGLSEEYGVLLHETEAYCVTFKEEEDIKKVNREVRTDTYKQVCVCCY